MSFEHHLDPVLSSPDEVRLDPQPQGRGSNELAIGGEVVLGLVVPVRMPPELEGLLEAVDVLGDPEFLDPLFLGGREIPIDIHPREVLPGVADLVGPQVQVVVRQHAPTVPASRVPPVLGKTLIVLAAFGVGVGLAELFGAKNLGTAFGVGQLTFVLALVYVLVRR